MIIESPHPPKKQIFSCGIHGSVSASGRPYPIPSAALRPGPRSDPCACSWKISSIVSGPSNRTPSTAPPRASAERIRATPRALSAPCRRRCRHGASPGCWRPPRRTQARSACGRPGSAGRGRRSRWAAAVAARRRRRAPVGFAGAALEVGSQRPCDLIGDERLERLATPCPAPTTAPARHSGPSPCPSRRGPRRWRAGRDGPHRTCVPADGAPRCVLARRGELRPVPSNRHVHVQQPTGPRGRRRSCSH
jgi:hypothetical protein